MRYGGIIVVDDGFPGRPSNLVGFANAPGYPGSLTAWPGGTGGHTLTDGTNAQSGSGTANDPWIFSFYDFDALSGGTGFHLNHAKFIGCRFQSNINNNGSNTATGVGNVSQDLTFSYCTFSPRTAIASTPPGGMWPSAGTGQDTVSGGSSLMTDNVNCTPGNGGYQHGFSTFNTTDGPFTWDHCDFWGFGNDAINFSAVTTAQMTVRDCWIHDACNASPLTYHTDGLGYLDGGTPPSNILVDHCTIASIGTTTGIAFQAATSGYANIIVQRSFLSGFNVCADMCHETTGSTGLVFTDNVYGTEVQWAVSANRGTTGAIWVSPTNVWRRNKFRVFPGSHPGSGATMSWSSADGGKYIVPVSALLSTTDWAN